MQTTHKVLKWKHLRNTVQFAHEVAVINATSSNTEERKFLKPPSHGKLNKKIEKYNFFIGSPMRQLIKDNKQMELIDPLSKHWK